MTRVSSDHRTPLAVSCYTTGAMKDKRGRKSGEKKAEGKLRTSREVYDRIRWDASFDASSCIIGYETRLSGLQEMRFDDFDPRGDIPWHRVWYFRMGPTL